MWTRRVLDLKKIWVLHHNTKPYTASIIRKLFEKGKIEVVAHLTYYSPNLGTCNFWVFRDLKWELCNRHFESDVELMTAVNCFFQNLPLEFHKTMTTKCKERMLVYIANEGGYLEKDIVDPDNDDDDKLTSFLPLKLISLHLWGVDRCYLF